MANFGMVNSCNTTVIVCSGSCDGICNEDCVLDLEMLKANEDMDESVLLPSNQGRQAPVVAMETRMLAQSVHREGEGHPAGVVGEGEGVTFVLGVPEGWESSDHDDSDQDDCHHDNGHHDDNKGVVRGEGSTEDLLWDVPNDWMVQYLMIIHVYYYKDFYISLSNHSIYIVDGIFYIFSSLEFVI